MINVDFTNIDNARLVGRLLPFWSRGKKLNLLLQAILSPITATHNAFKAWALERYIECHITAQKGSIEWFLKHRLQSHFYREEDNFYITSGVADSEMVCCFSGTHWDDELPWDNYLTWESQSVPLVNMNTNLSCTNTGYWENKMLWNNQLLWEDEEIDPVTSSEYAEVPGQINVYAPAIVDTTSYDREDYERDIRNIMSKYMICFNKINIIVLDTNTAIQNP